MDFASEEDMQKALELNGKKVMGQEVKLDRARSKDSSQEGKKGKHCFHLVKVQLSFQAANFGNSQNTGKKLVPGPKLTLKFVLQREMQGHFL